MDWRALASPGVLSVSAVHARARAATRPVKGPADKQDRKNDCASRQDEIAGKVPLSPSGERSKRCDNEGWIAHVLLSFGNVAPDLVNSFHRRLSSRARKLLFAATKSRVCSTNRAGGWTLCGGPSWGRVGKIALGRCPRGHAARGDFAHPTRLEGQCNGRSQQGEPE